MVSKVHFQCFRCIGKSFYEAIAQLALTGCAEQTVKAKYLLEGHQYI